MLDTTEMMFNNFEPKLSNRFVFYVDGLPAFLIKGAARPTVTTEEVVLNHINVNRKVKGKTSWGDISLSLYDPIVPSAAQAAMEWFRLSHESVTGRDGYAEMYKKDCTIKILGPVGDVVEEWTLKGAWPKEVSFKELAYESADAMTLDITLAIDYAILNY